MNFFISQLFKKFIFRTQEQNVSSKIFKNKDNRVAETSVDEDDFEDLSGNEDESEEWSPNANESLDLSSDEDEDMKSTETDKPSDHGYV